MSAGYEKRKTNWLIEIRDALLFLFWVVFLGYVFPALSCLVINFSMLVVFGDCKISEFDWKFYSAGMVNGFYRGIFTWVQDLIFRLQH